LPRSASSEAAVAQGERGVNVSIIRLPQVHDPLKQGLVSPLIAIAREKGMSAYVGNGLNRWPAAHVLDVAFLYRLALEQASPGAVYNAVAEEGVPVRDIAEVIGKHLKLPVVSLSQEDAAEHFGWLGVFVGLDLPASSTHTRAVLGWHLTGPGLLADLEQGRFYQD
jgi:nucleoside-diphosphate-sugar epimerase